jgi:organic radical activating enzyme
MVVFNQINQQPIESRVSRTETDMLDVHHIWRTFQGEGPYAGMPAVFVRLAGCVIQCPACDTDYTSNRRLMDLPNIVLAIDELVPRTFPIKPLVVLTGGEPFRQPLTDLVTLLHDLGFLVQIETNGLVYDETFPFDLATIVCSPKTPIIKEQLIPHIAAFKYVVAAGRVDPLDGLPTQVLGYNHRAARPPVDWDLSKVYVQPEDAYDPAINRSNLDTAIESCLNHGYRLCLQMHKIIGWE